MRLERYDTMLEQAQIRKAELSQKILKLKSEETEQAEEAKNGVNSMKVSARVLKPLEKKRQAMRRKQKRFVRR